MKPQIIAHANQLTLLQQRSHKRSHTQSSSPFCGKEATNDRTRKAAHPSAAKKPQTIAHANQLTLLRQRSHKRSHMQSSSPFCGKEATNYRTRKAAHPSAAKKPQTSSPFCGKEATNDRTRKAAHPSAAKKPQMIAHAKQLTLLWQRSHKRSHTQSSSPIRGNEARSIAQSHTHSGSAGNNG